MEGKTTFIATHRLDFAINADAILMLKNGELIQKGSHKELIKIEGEYKEFFTLN